MAIDKIQSESINLADNFAFTGTVSGAGGITVADQWRVTADFNNTQFVTANWERADTYGSGQIGSNVTESSGVFTFPSTGIYQINFATRFSRGTGQAFVIGEIHVTTNDSNYYQSANGIGNVPVADYYDGIFVTYLFDVTSTSTHKVKFKVETNDTAVNFNGNTSLNHTYAQFIRLGDT